MKQKISITVDKHALKLIDNFLKEGSFRNRSHIIEYSLNKFINENSRIKLTKTIGVKNE